MQFCLQLPLYRLALNLGASATVGGLCHTAERPVR